jgi:hypothetical protein
MTEPAFPKHPLFDSSVNDVPPLASPEVASGMFRFSMRGMAMMVVICSVLAALVSMMGVWQGLAVGLIITVITLVVVFFTGFAFYNPTQQRSSTMAALDVWSIRLVVLITLLFFGAAFAGAGQIAMHYFGQVAVATEMSRRAGFQYEIVEHLYQYQSRKYVKVVSVAAASPAEQAGLGVGDIIVEDSPRELFKRMNENRGRKLSLKVANLPSQQDSAEWATRPVELTVPDN